MRIVLVLTIFTAITSLEAAPFEFFDRLKKKIGEGSRKHNDDEGESSSRSSRETAPFITHDEVGSHEAAAFGFLGPWKKKIGVGARKHNEDEGESSSRSFRETAPLIIRDEVSSDEALTLNPQGTVTLADRIHMERLAEERSRHESRTESRAISRSRTAKRAALPELTRTFSTLTILPGGAGPSRSTEQRQDERATSRGNERRTLEEYTEMARLTEGCPPILRSPDRSENREENFRFAGVGPRNPRRSKLSERAEGSSGFSGRSFRNLTFDEVIERDFRGRRPRPQGDSSLAVGFPERSGPSAGDTRYSIWEEDVEEDLGRHPPNSPIECDNELVRRADVPPKGVPTIRNLLSGIWSRPKEPTSSRHIRHGSLVRESVAGTEGIRDRMISAEQTVEHSTVTRQSGRDARLGQKFTLEEEEEGNLDSDTSGEGSSNEKAMLDDDRFGEVNQMLICIWSKADKKLTGEEMEEVTEIMQHFAGAGITEDDYKKLREYYDRVYAEDINRIMLAMSHFNPEQREDLWTVIAQIWDRSYNPLTSAGSDIFEIALERLGLQTQIPADGAMKSREVTDSSAATGESSSTLSVPKKRILVKREPIECCICFYDLGEKTQFLKCTHKFHEHCIKGWAERKEECPICGDSFILSQLFEPENLSEFIYIEVDDVGEAEGSLTTEQEIPKVIEEEIDDVGEAEGSLTTEQEIPKDIEEEIDDVGEAEGSSTTEQEIPKVIKEEIDDVGVAEGSSSTEQKIPKDIKE